MTHEDKTRMAVEVFFEQTKREGKLPYDLWVPIVIDWRGLDPAPCDHYQVEYTDGVREEAEPRRREDATLEALRGSLDFALREESKVLRVYSRSTR
jgi:hypothetical protein